MEQLARQRPHTAGGHPHRHQLGQHEFGGGRLRDKQNWDGGLATSFSGSLWPGVESALASMLTQLDQLQDAIASVNRGIAAAGN